MSRSPSPTRRPGSRPGPATPAAATLLAAALALAAPPGAAAAERPVPTRAAPQEASCQRCHGELEFLRQQAGETLAEARRVLVRPSDLAGTAHDGMACGECHTGFGRFPHRADRTTTSSCADCHGEAAGAWERGIHAEGEEAPHATCRSCHATHEVAPASELTGEGAARSAMDARCVSCHQTAELPDDDPHAGEVACASCHAPHETRLVDAAESRVWRSAQLETCGTCHDSIASVWREDVHGQALTGPAGPAGRAEPEPPSCTDCHGAHGMLAVGAGATADTVMVARCGACHGYYEDTYFGTYHGKATAVGSRVTATCHDCHSAHRVFPASDARSTVSDERATETCGACHGHVRPAFTAYESHPDPMDRSKNPILFYSFWFMNILLVSVLGVFGLHTLLWWVRLEIDRRRGIEHEIGGSHE